MRIIAKSILKEKDIAPLPQSLEGGISPVLISGLSAVHRSVLAASLYLESERPLFIICPDDTAAEAMEKDIGSLLGIKPTTITNREFTFYSAESVSRQAEQRRLFALDAILEGSRSVTICTVSGLLQRTLPPEYFMEASFTLSVGDSLDPMDAENRLLKCGYIRTNQVEGPGQYSRRGGIFDFFSPAYDYPVRCEFWGDEIDSMGFFDVSSQRRIENLQTCRILPASETLIHMHKGGAEALSAAVGSLLKRKSAKTQSLSETLDEDAERIKHTGSLPAADRYMALIYPEISTVLDYVPLDSLVLLSEPSKSSDRARGYLKQLSEDVKVMIETGKLAGPISVFSESWDGMCLKLESFPVVMADAFTVGNYPLNPKKIIGIMAKQLSNYGGSVEAAAEDAKAYTDRGFSVVALASDERRAKILSDYFKEQKIPSALEHELNKFPAAGRCTVSVGALSSGFELPDTKIAVLTDSQLLKGGVRKTKRKKALQNREKLDSYTDLSPGDYVVHEYHGIGKFAGISKMKIDGVEKDYIKICYAGTDSIYVPATQLDLVTKYIGGGENKTVKLSKMGGADWTRVKTRAKAAAKEMAGELVKLYAARQRQRGHAFAQDSVWQTEFEDAFNYQETDDQLRSIMEIKEDMQREIPMDRLLCGDVGYGKTEVALRAVMKCVLDGKQAAFLVPTTVLAQQHYQTAMQRFFGYPIKIEMLSRFRTPAQIKHTLQGIKDGSVDIVIGTHKLLQKDVRFKDLGLLIVDEEQRFGVSHKERLKEICRQVDALTLTATPIPRTLSMALHGIRDMSKIEEPPQDRLPVQTYVMEHDWDVLCDAIRREIHRGGQVYYLHNRVENIERVASRLAAMLEDISVSVAHGRMGEEELSLVMDRMSSGEVQVLVCTTIIETGIDIPNVNTLIIEDADHLGLAQLHQIRGRVGRSSRRASAYLTFRKNKVLTEVAEKRLSAIREFAEFNSGLKIAERDLEIRGAGNLLGAEQSGYMISVGYDMYLKLLEEAVLEERGEKPEKKAECAADLAVSANIPESYVSSAEQRMDLYRRIAMIRTEEEADDLTDELIDRFGDPPPAVNALIHVALLRGEATRAGVLDVSQKSGYLYFILSDFDMEKVSVMYGRKEYKGRLRVEAGQSPRLSLRIKNSKRVLEEARMFVSSYTASVSEEAG